MSNVVYLEEHKRRILDAGMREEYKEFFKTYGWLPLKQHYIIEDMLKFEEKLKNEQERIK